MLCPNCQLENPASATRCDCGHAFTAGMSSRDDVCLRSIAGSIATIKRIAIGWTVAAVIVFVAGLIYRVSR